MAHSCRASLLLRPGWFIASQQRSFCHHALRAAPKPTTLESQRPAQPADRSMRIASRNMQAMPSDLGLLDDTFVPPCRSNLPSLFRSPRDFVKLQSAHVRSHLRDLISLFVLKWASPKGTQIFSRKVKLYRRQIVPTAIALHQQMYSAFADSDSKLLRKLCADGVYESFRARIAARGRGENVRWELLEYPKRAKLVSNRAARLPVEGGAIHQAVVRIYSRQRLTRFKPDGTIIPGTGKEKDLVENVVVQQKYWQWEKDDWQIWGTTEETSVDDVMNWESAT